MPVADEEHVRIPPDGLLGTIHRPAGAPRAAVLFCNPLLEERKSAYRVCVEAARDLSDHGVAVLRFDYRGCGDSPGNLEEVRGADWQRDLVNAYAYIAAACPGVQTGLIALRGGALLALPFSVQEPSVRFVVLWEPVTSGRDYLRQEVRRTLVKEMMTTGDAAGRAGELRREALEGTTIDLGGFALTPLLRADVDAMDLALSAPGLRCPALVMHISHRDRPSAPIVKLQSCLAHGELHVEVVQAQPFWSLVGIVDASAVVRLTTRWVVSCLPGGA